jgi:mannose-6-phosphate isomerase-like protein (cupin superfamily)
VLALARDVKDQWYNQTLCQVNGSVIRLGVMQGEYHWHKHDNDDEFFFCLQGEFLVDLEGWPAPGSEDTRWRPNEVRPCCASPSDA